MNSNRPTGSVESYTPPPRLSRTRRAVSSSAIARASGRDRGRPVQLGDDGCRRPGTRPAFPQTWSFGVATGQPVIDIDSVGSHGKGGEPFALDGEVLSSVEYQA